MILTRTTELLGEKPYSATLYTTYLTGTKLGLNPGLNIKRPVTNHLKHGTVWLMEYSVCLLVKLGLHSVDTHNILLKIVPASSVSYRRPTPKENDTLLNNLYQYVQ